MQDHWLPGFNFNVEKWDATGQNYETLAICRWRRAFAAAIAEKTAGRFHDPEPHAGGAATLGGRLVSGSSAAVLGYGRAL
jgi:hypothetical protein